MQALLGHDQVVFIERWSLDTSGRFHCTWYVILTVHRLSHGGTGTGRGGGTDEVILNINLIARGRQVRLQGVT